MRIAYTICVWISSLFGFGKLPIDFHGNNIYFLFSDILSLPYVNNVYNISTYNFYKLYICIIPVLIIFRPY